MDLPDIDFDIFSTMEPEVQLEFSADSFSREGDETVYHPPPSLSLDFSHQWKGDFSAFNFPTFSGLEDDLTYMRCDAGHPSSARSNAAQPSLTPVSSYIGGSDFDLLYDASDSGDSLDEVVPDFQLDMDAALVPGVNDAWLCFLEMSACLSTWPELIRSLSSPRKSNAAIIETGVGAQPVLDAPDFSCLYSDALMETDSVTEGSDLRSYNGFLPIPPPDVATYDTYEWKKYGEKTAKSSVHPRKYFRCKFIGCVAQKTEEVLEGGKIWVMYKNEHDHKTRSQIAGSPTNDCGASESVWVGERDGIEKTSHRTQEFNVKSATRQKRDTLRRAKGLGRKRSAVKGSGSIKYEQGGLVESGNRPIIAAVKQEVDSFHFDVTSLEGSPKVVVGQKRVDRRRECIEKRVGVGSRQALEDGHQWRKYGETKIGKEGRICKSYYKCSDVKSCAVRKTVQWNVADPDEVVVVYKGMHDHCPLLRYTVIKDALGQNLG